LHGSQTSEVLETSEVFREITYSFRLYEYKGKP